MASNPRIRVMLPSWTSPIDLGDYCWTRQQKSYAIS